MKGCVWILIALGAFTSVTNAFDRPFWSSDCPSENNPSARALFPHPLDCGKFYKCLNSTAYPFSCPFGLHWNQFRNLCDYAEAADCQSARSRTHGPVCPLDGNRYEATYLPNENDCGRYYECLGGHAHPMTCPDGQHWSVELDQCVHPFVSNCKQKESRTLPNVDLSLCPLYDDPDNPTQLPYPGDCTKFYKCSFGRLYAMNCPFALHWDVKSNRCDSPFIAQCNKGPNPPPPPPPTSTIKPTTVTKRPDPNPPIDPYPPVDPYPPIDPNLPVDMPECSDVTSVRKFGIPGVCKEFMACNRGKAYKISCREGREWSVRANDCVDAAIAECSGTSAVRPSPTTRPTTTTTTTTRPATQSSRTCAQGAEYLPHPHDCHKYIQCDNMKPIERDCPDGLYWSKTGTICEWFPNDC